MKEKWEGIKYARYLLMGLIVVAGLAMVLLFTSQTGEALTLIYDVDDLQAMNQTLSEDYELANDIDASATTGWVGGFNPVGNLSAAFTGNFSGNGYTISNLYIDRWPEDYVGLFGAVSGPYGNIKDVTLENVDITGNDYTGALIGHDSASGIIENCNVSGTVLGDNYVGGMMGHNEFGAVMYCSASVDVTMDSTGGGLISQNENSPISYCYATGDVTALVPSYGYGGLVGDNMDSDITYSYATGNVNAGYRVGGFVGSHAGNSFDIISYCYSTGNVVGTNEQIGGFVGWNNWAKIEKCYSLGDVTGNNKVGGFVGENRWATTISSYSTGYVTGNTNVGGYCGYEDGNTLTTEGFWDLNTSGQLTSVNGTGKNTTELLMTSTYIGAGWDLTNDWWMLDNETRPFLRMEYSTKIRNSHHLQLMLLGLGADYTLLRDIDVSDTAVTSQMWGTNLSTGSGFVPVGNATDKFNGNLYGDDYSINNLFINRSSGENIGLFGYVDTGTSVENITLQDVDITGWRRVGSLAGTFDGVSVSNCHASGQVLATDIYCGGLIGYSKTTISNCSTNVSTTGQSQYTGGLVGRHDGGIIKDTNSYGYTLGYSDSVGGLVGSIEMGTVMNCSTYGDVDGLGSGYSIGGLVGYYAVPSIPNDVTNCHTFGDVDGYGFVGGVIGFASSGGDMNDCTSHGEISARQEQLGGLIGRNNALVITNSIVYGNVSLPLNKRYVGGLTGFTAGSISNSICYGNVTGAQEVGGLVGQTFNGPSITNSKVYGDVTGVWLEIGGIVGDNDGSDIINCHSYGLITGNNWIGGLIGYNIGGSCSDSTVNGDVNATADRVGGLIGYNTGSGTIDNCTTYGYTYGSNYVGGLIGWNIATGSVTDSIAHGNVTGINDRIGGLIGKNDGLITNCKAYGNTTGYNLHTGGLIGDNTGTVTDCRAYGYFIEGYLEVGGLIGWNNGGTVTLSSSFGNVNGSDDIGGLIGWNTAIVSNCSAYGDATGVTYVGGLIGYNDGGTVTDCSAYGDASGIDNIGGLIADNSVVTSIVTRCNATGKVTGTGGYSGGLIAENGGTVNDSWADAETDGSTEVGGLIGYNHGTGTITNCTAYGDVTGTGNNVGGLIGQNSGGSITDCTAYGNTTGSGSSVGGLIGENTGDVTICIAYGDTNGTGDNIGGLIGYNNGGTVTNCTALGTTNGAVSYTGGLIGYNTGDVMNCTAFGDTAGVDETGGLMGENDGTVTNCYAFGNTTGNTDVGGLIGYNWNGPVTNCTAYGDTYGTGEYAGGLIGYNDGGDITRCIAYGDTTSESRYAGGLIGRSTGAAITGCTSYGNTTGMIGYTGGLIGVCTLGTVTNSIAWGNTNGTGDYTGGLIGISNCEITNSTSYGDTKGGGGYVGGLVGSNNGPATNCSTYGNTQGGGQWVGGLFGRTTDNVTDCNTYGDTNGTGQDVGGLIGYNLGGTVTNCNVYGNTLGANDNVGGLIGENAGPINNCTTHGNTTGKSDYVGGLIGNNNETVTNCRTYGNTTGNFRVGGLIGGNVGAAVTDSTTQGTTNGTSQEVGGLIGYNTGTVTNCTVNGNTIGNFRYTGGLIGYHVSGVVKNCNVYGSTTGVNIYVGGLMGYNNNGEVTNCSVYGNTSGMFNYNGGLIGRNSGTVKACSVFGVVGINVNWVGGLIGDNLGSGTVENSTFYGSVDGNFHIGGLIGLNAGTVETSYSKGTINGLTNVGGLIGLNIGTVTNSYSHSDVNGNNRVGGLIGNNSGSVMNCYSKGNVIGSTDPGGLIGINFAGTVTNCFWDNETSGWLTSDGGTGEVTKVMMLQGTFTGVGWDFANIWGIIEANTYPFLLPLENYPPASADLEITITDMPDPALLGGTLYYYVNVTGRGPDNSGLVVVTIDLPSEVSYVSDNQGIGPPVGNTLTWDIGSLNNGEILSCYIQVTVDSFGTGTITCSGSVVSVTTDPGVYANSTFNDTAVNRLPNAFDDLYTIDEDTILNIVAPGVLGNDTDPDLDTLIVTAYDTTSTQGAVVAMIVDGSYTYDPTGVSTLQALAVGEWMLDTFQYTIDDGRGGTDVATVTINVTGVNDVPIASDDVSSTDEDTVLITVAPGVLANDNDPDTSDTMTILAFDATSRLGMTITLNADGSYSYDPTGLPIFQALAEGESLIDSFNYTISDGNGGTDNATVNITVDGVNDLPTANDDTKVIDEDTVLNVGAPGVLGNDTDPDTLDTLTVTDFDALSVFGATVMVNMDGSYTYDPTGATAIQALAEGEWLLDTFQYTIDDGHGGTDVAVVTINITGVNDVPIASDDVSSTDEETVMSAIAPGVLTNDNDPDTSDTLTILAFDATSKLGVPITLNPDGSYSYDPTGLPIFQVLAAGESLIDSFNYTVSDGNGGTNNATVSITVNGMNDEPTANDDANTIDENMVLNIVTPGVLGNDTDPDTSDTLTVVDFDGLSTYGATVTVNANGSYNYDPTGSVILQALAFGETLLDSFNYTINDGNGGTANATVIITVNGRNDDPTANDDANIIDEDTVLNVVAPGVLGNDMDLETSDILTVIDFDALSANGATVTVNADGSYTYDTTGVPAFQALVVGEWVVDTFQYTIDDGNGGTDTATVTINVTGVNDWPTANDDTEAIDEDTVLNVTAPGVLANDTDSDASDALIVIPGNLVTLNGANVGINADGSYTYDPTGSAVLQALAVDESLVDSFNYTVSDGNGGTANAMVYITVNGVNDIPTPDDDTWVTDEESVLNVPPPGILGDDNDPDTSDGLTVIGFDDTSTWGATILVNSDGSYNYDPTGSAIFQALAEDENLIDSFTYTVSDGNGGTATAAVYITVNGVNDIPTITITDMIEAVGDQLYSVDYNATDIDTSDILTWSLNSNATWLEINLATGILDGSPTNADAGQYWVNVSISDGKGGVHWTNFILEVLLDSDGDGTPDIDDTDDDGDDVIDVDDDFPLNPNEDTDTDGDGTGNNADTDDDDDGLLDTEEDVNDNGVVNEGETDPLDPDTDGDEYDDMEDYAPLDPNIWEKPVETEEELPITLIVIPIIVIIVLILLMMLLRKGKSGEELPAEEEVPEEDTEALEDEEEISDEELEETPKEDLEALEDEDLSENGEEEISEGGWEESEAEEEGIGEEESGDVETEFEEEDSEITNNSPPPA